MRYVSYELVRTIGSGPAACLPASRSRAPIPTSSCRTDCPFAFASYHPHPLSLVHSNPSAPLSDPKPYPPRSRPATPSKLKGVEGDDERARAGRWSTCCMSGE
eukprot:764835-Hanusia_phi.AAC.1